MDIFCMRQYAIPVFIILSLGYFSYHTVSGERGFLAFIKKKKEIEKIRKIQEELNLEKIKMEKRIRLLGREIDLDMLEECAKKNLHFAFENEKIIINKESGGSDET
jgi:cell division protein FtsB